MPDPTSTAFAGDRLLARGPRPDVAHAARQALDEGETAPILFFDDETGRVFDLDLSGDAAAVATRHAPPPVGPGRPKLGVVAREVARRKLV